MKKEKFYSDDESQEEGSEDYSDNGSHSCSLVASHKL